MKKISLSFSVFVLGVGISFALKHTRSPCEDEPQYYLDKMSGAYILITDESSICELGTAGPCTYIQTAPNHYSACKIGNFIQY